jgi:putative DNA primase/helicase
MWKGSHHEPSDVRVFLDNLLPYPIRWKHDEGVTRCPFHNDKTPSFSVNPTKGVWICFAGCGDGTIKSLTERLGKHPPVFNSLTQSLKSPPIKKYKRHEQEYLYWDIFDSPKFLIGRDSTPSGKKFIMYHYENDEWIMGKGDYSPIPYQLPEVISAINRGLPVLIVEGEKDADKLNNAFGYDQLVATTNMGGAGNWSDADYYNGYLGDASIFIIPDNDEVGLQHAQKVANSVGKYAKEVHIINLPGLPPKGDVSDWLANGNTTEELFELMKSSHHAQSPVPNKIEIDIMRKYFDGSRFVPALLAKEILQSTPFFSDGNQLFAYQDGVYRANGENLVRLLCLNMLGNEYRINHVREVMHYIHTQAFVDPAKINMDDGRISLLNGLFDLAEHTLLPHIPNRQSTIQLPVAYDANAKCPQITAFLGQVIPADAIPTVLEFIGYCLTMNAKYEKALMPTGTGANGKSTFIKLVEAFLGKTNTTSIPLHELAESRFKRADLQGTLLNTFGDISSRQLETSSIFKAIVSGDKIDAERKGKDPFYFKPYSKLLFSANELPGSKDFNKAYLRRWIVMPFPNSFDYGRNADPDLISKLTTSEEMSGLLNLALEGLKRLYTNNKFTESETTRKAIDNFLIEADSVVGFINECCELHDGAECQTMVLYSGYKRWCEESGLRPLGKSSFYKRLVDQFPQLIKGRRNKQKEYWEGITIT